MRNGKQCRERWRNHLRPELNKGDWTQEEDVAIWSRVQQLGTKWAQISELYMPLRTDNDIKNRWNSIIRKPKAPGGREWTVEENEARTAFIGTGGHQAKRQRVSGSHFGLQLDQTAVLHELGSGSAAAAQAVAAPQLGAPMEVAAVAEAHEEVVELAASQPAPMLLAENATDISKPRGRPPNRQLPPAPAAASGYLGVGSRVSANWQMLGYWHPATVLALLDGGAYQLQCGRAILRRAIRRNSA